jgi:hypothetical protein
MRRYNFQSIRRLFHFGSRLQLILGFLSRFEIREVFVSSFCQHLLTNLLIVIYSKSRVRFT